ncbi:uncharacterized protein PHALS_07150 [Plasmopara halstedii]|uniref:Uncharacterized protein n=1 Tax=Plasmopara halstedii TaxID=4781 RepID=A0A0P1B4S4_PLAHL|nr:uncharacterized protein PHALS_07150 [Plasmopara halstedii]CEG49385.1 hypothetical protein PHALS_07150 [Plasmopara halstedii]|eukprot:XP_024585754.1 hypothetical protein PHALS_07150 [Plasmopara halstedii]
MRLLKCIIFLTDQMMTYPRCSPPISSPVDYGNDEGELLLKKFDIQVMDAR